MTFSTCDVIGNLNSKKYGFDELSGIAVGTGVYAIFLLCSLPGTPSEEILCGPAYVGLSNDRNRRLIRQHFMEGCTPQSSLRRSLGALLRDQLKLEPEGLGRGKFRFAIPGERCLTNWMHKHIKIGLCPIPLAQLSAVERKIIRHLCPPLNLTHWDNPLRTQIKRLRRECANCDPRV